MLTDLHEVVSQIKARNISFAGQLKIFVYHLLELSLRKSRRRRLHIAFDKVVPCKSALRMTLINSGFVCVTLWNVLGCFKVSAFMTRLGKKKKKQTLLV